MGIPKSLLHRVRCGMSPADTLGKQALGGCSVAAALQLSRAGGLRSAAIGGRCNVSLAQLIG